MRIIFKIVFLLCFFVTHAQIYTVTPLPGSEKKEAVQNKQGGANEYLAQNYFDRGEYDKAVVMYETLHQNSPNNHQYFQKLVTCYQQLKQYTNADSIIKTRLEKTKQPNLFVDYGYNFQLQNQTEKANKYYQQALNAIHENPNYSYTIAREFELKILLPQAIEAYSIGQKLNPNNNYDYQIALLQGQQGKIDLMIDALVDYSYKFPSNLTLVQNQFNRFLSEDHTKVFSDYLRKALLIRTQKNQDIFWNEFMSWFFTQQKEYGKAFIQEKAIYKRNPESLSNIIGLANLTLGENESDTASEILNFIIENNNDASVKITAQAKLLDIELKKLQPKDYVAFDQKMEQLIQQSGFTAQSLPIILLQAHFQAFYINQFEKAKTNLTKALDLNLNQYGIATVKLELADVLLLNEKYNQAIIYYAQVEEDLNNDETAHQASLKMAKANYYKGDFEWAQKQFQVLKSSTSQLIANDALQMFLLISDNTVEDSTQVALKKYSKADFLAFQNKNDLALAEFKKILDQHKSESIADETLFQMAKIYEKQQNWTEALKYYQEIIDKHAEDIYIDEAYFFSAEIYNKQLANTEKAKTYYEKIIFNHPDSIYFVQAQTNYRKLRGDSNL